MEIVNSGVACPSCGNRSSAVNDSRSTVRGIRRRRSCDCCGYRFSTLEKIEKMHKGRTKKVVPENKIIELAKEGKGRMEIATETGVSYSKVCEIIKLRLVRGYVEKSGGS